MNLHNEIMNIQVNPSQLDGLTSRETLLYKIGHRDARHAAAELSIEAERYIKELEEAALEALKDLEYVEQKMWGGIKNTAAEKIRDALKVARYIIRHDTTSLCWNNDSGWGSRGTATIFSEEERNTLNLPIGGSWEKV